MPGPLQRVLAEHNVQLERKLSERTDENDKLRAQVEHMQSLLAENERVIGDTHRQERTLILAESKPLKMSAVSELYNTLDLSLSRPRQRPTTVGDDGWVTSVSMTSFRAYQDSGRFNLTLPTPEVGHSLDRHFDQTPTLSGAQTQRPPAREGRPALPHMPQPPRSPRSPSSAKSSPRVASAEKSSSTARLLPSPASSSRPSGSAESSGSASSSGSSSCGPSAASNNSHGPSLTSPVSKETRRASPSGSRGSSKRGATRDLSPKTSPRVPAPPSNVAPKVSSRRVTLNRHRKGSGAAAGALSISAASSVLKNVAKFHPVTSLMAGRPPAGEIISIPRSEFEQVVGTLTFALNASTGSRAGWVAKSGAMHKASLYFVKVKLPQPNSDSADQPLAPLLANIKVLLVEQLSDLRSTVVKVRIMSPVPCLPPSFSHTDTYTISLPRSSSS